jgi:integrase
VAIELDVDADEVALDGPLAQPEPRARRGAQGGAARTGGIGFRAPRRPWTSRPRPTSSASRAAPDVSRDLHKHALEDAALHRSLRLHDLRHTAASSWLAAGLPLIYVQRQLRHASITTAQPVYGHLEESFLRGAAKRAESLIWTGGRIGRWRRTPRHSHGCSTTGIG